MATLTIGCRSVLNSRIWAEVLITTTTNTNTFVYIIVTTKYKLLRMKCLRVCVCTVGVQVCLGILFDEPNMMLFISLRCSSLLQLIYWKFVISEMKFRLLRNIFPYLDSLDSLHSLDTIGELGSISIKKTSMKLISPTNTISINCEISSNNWLGISKCMKNS